MAARAKQSGRKAAAASGASRSQSGAAARAAVKPATKATSSAAAKSVAAKKAKAGKPSRSAKPTGANAGGQAANSATIARLEAELTVARARIAELEKQHEDVVNRIDWAIDSLQTLLSKGA